MIYIGADHRGFELKEQIKVWLIEQGYDVEDVGNFILDPDDDYVDPAIKVGEMVHGSDGRDMGILLCGSGHGVEMVANRFTRVRAIIAYNEQVTIQGREHEDANVLVLPVNWLTHNEALERVSLFLQTEADKRERYERRRMRMANMRVNL
ncbi:MAG: ribose-5-phosphate isomerase [bacterium]|nr:RpiB/LacA/LacB family sugar-phosphate isomerase [Candidatus Microgenomates bacterium CPR3]MCQ3944770.1 ribose-5-phosphate isomerase [bacterium]RIK51659.1 MAG: ribose-5-phosphate isomerase [Candidatus Microgenomates bacterium]